MKQEASKRIVSKGEYIRLQGKRIGVLLSGVILFFGVTFGTSILLVQTLLYSRIDHVHNGSYILVGWFLTGTLIGLIIYSDVWYRKLQKKVASIDPGLPLTRTNTADLPAPGSLVRASQEPSQAQEIVLLRAASETTERQEAQLLRASGGGQE